MTLAALSFVLALQAPASASRIDQIWQAADERMARQVDLWFKDGDYPRLIQLLRFRSELFPGDYEIWTDLGWMLENVEDLAAALSVYRNFRERNPGEKDAPYPEANFYFQKKQFAKVPPLIEPTIGKDPHPNSYRILGHAYEQMGKFQDSARIWETYLKRHPDDEAAKRNLERVRAKGTGKRGVYGKN